MSRYEKRTITLGAVRPEQIQEPEDEVEIQTVRTSYGSSFRVLTAGSPDAQVLVRPIEWSGFVDRRDEIDRNRMIAAALGKRVVAIDNLGLGIGTSGISPAMSKELRRGNFGAMAEQQLEAIETRVGNLDAVSLYGSSLASGVSFAMAAQMDHTHVDEIIALETVGMEPQPLPLLAAKYGVEGLAWYCRYLRKTVLDRTVPEWMVPPMSDHQKATATFRGMYDYPAGLSSKGAMTHAVWQAFERGSIDTATRVVVANTSKSIVSLERENDRLAELLDAGGADVERMIIEGESHGIIDAPVKLYEFLQTTKRQN